MHSDQIRATSPSLSYYFWHINPCQIFFLYLKNCSHKLFQFGISMFVNNKITKSLLFNKAFKHPQYLCTIVALVLEEISDSLNEILIVNNHFSHESFWVNFLLLSLTRFGWEASLSGMWQLLQEVYLKLLYESWINSFLCLLNLKICISVFHLEYTYVCKIQT